MEVFFFFEPLTSANIRDFFFFFFTSVSQPPPRVVHLSVCVCVCVYLSHLSDKGGLYVEWMYTNDE